MWQNWAWWHDRWHVEVTLCIIVFMNKEKTFWASEEQIAKLSMMYTGELR